MANISRPFATISSSDPADVNRYLDGLWHSLKSDEDVRTQCEAKGIDLSAIDEIEHNPIQAKRDQVASGGGFVEGILVGMAVAAATKATEKFVEALWELYMKPKLKNRVGKLEDLEKVEDVD